MTAANSMAQKSLTRKIGLSHMSQASAFDVRSEAAVPPSRWCRGDGSLASFHGITKPLDVFLGNTSSCWSCRAQLNDRLALARNGNLLAA
jgi:hypothetical protein